LVEAEEADEKESAELPATVMMDMAVYEKGGREEKEIFK